MNPNQTHTIRSILGGLREGFSHGAISMCGGDRIVCVHPERDQDRECRPSKRSSVQQDGTIDSEVYVEFAVNGKRGEDWKVTVSFEPRDSFTIRLWKSCGGVGRIITELGDVSLMELSEKVICVYDQAIDKYCDGIIQFD